MYLKEYCGCCSWQASLHSGTSSETGKMNTPPVVCLAGVSLLPVRNTHDSNLLSALFAVVSSVEKASGEVACDLHRVHDYVKYQRQGCYCAVEPPRTLRS